MKGMEECEWECGESDWEWEEYIEWGCGCGEAGGNAENGRIKGIRVGMRESGLGMWEIREEILGIGTNIGVYERKWDI